MNNAPLTTNSDQFKKTGIRLLKYRVPVVAYTALLEYLKQENLICTQVSTDGEFCQVEIPYTKEQDSFIKGLDVYIRLLLQMNFAALVTLYNLNEEKKQDEKAKEEAEQKINKEYKPEAKQTFSEYYRNRFNDSLKG
jgi:hypothetical protein